MAVKKFFRVMIAAVACLGMAAGCAGTHGSPAEKTGASANGAQTTGESLGDVQVFAAASLNTVLKEIVKETVEKDHPGTKPLFQFQGSQNLVDQMAGGAPADILLTADEKNMKKAVDKSLVKDPQIFTGNTLVLVVPKGNPGKVTSFGDGSLDGKRLVVCAHGVPCGNATEKLSELNNVRLRPVSEEQKVTDVLDKVSSGEADAGVVYKTDAMLRKTKVEVIEIPKADQVVNKYMIAIAATAPNAKASQAVLDAVLSDAGQAILEKYGFMPVAQIK